jgi:Predicted nucleoside-diphosphate-sugar epimerase
VTACPALVFLLSDSIRGHLFQGRGVAGWLSRFTGADVVEMDVPRLTGWERTRLFKWKARFLPSMDGAGAVRWIQEAGGSSLLDRAGHELAERHCGGNSVLFLSAGSGAASFTLALARATGQKCCTLMTPSVLGTAPFDFAVVPEHDHPEKRENVLSTLGAPNAIFPDELERKGWGALPRNTLPGKTGGQGEPVGVCWVGRRRRELPGSPPNGVRRALGPILEAGAKSDADFYITTSRRTCPEAEEELLRLTGSHPNVKMLLLASRDPFNPVPGMLGLCSRIFVTEDSVSMVSEAVTAGREVFLLRTERQSPGRTALQETTAFLVRKKILPGTMLWGIPRFDALFSSLITKGFLKEAHYDRLYTSVGTSVSLHSDGPVLNEAKRAAEWIMERWGK